jgi:hypothetical protein
MCPYFITMTDPSYNRMSAIKIGGTYVNVIDTSYGNVSLDVSGHTFLRGNLYVGGTTNIDISGGGFSANDLSLNGNLTVGGYIKSDVLDFKGISSILDVSNGAQFFARSSDMLFQSGGSGSLYFQTSGNGNVVFGAVDGAGIFDVSGDASFISRKGTLTMQTDKEDVVLFGAGVNSEIRLETDTQDIVLNPRGTGVLGNVVVNGQLQVLSGIKCKEATNTLYMYDTNYFEVLGSNGAQIDLFQTGSVSKSVTLGLNTSTNNGYVGSGGTNVDFAVSAGRYLRLTNPLYCDYTPTDITQNYQIGWTQNSNTGNTYSATASDTGTPARIATFNLPSFGVWLIQFDCLLTLNTGSDTINNRGIFLSDASGSTTPCAPGFEMTDPIDDAAGSAGSRQTYSFSGIYHYTTPGTAAKYINVYATTNGSRTVTASGSYKYTRIA